MLCRIFSFYSCRPLKDALELGQEYGIELLEEILVA